MAIQGANDEYGTMAQIESIARSVPQVEVVALERCGHSPHRDQPEATLEAIGRFLARLAP
jgi:pimeloyl-ACP methyl ester carboxylesterase